MILTVFGASGQVGKQVVREALAKNYTVKAFGRNVTGLFDEESRNSHLEAITGYVFDEEQVFNAIKGSDAVISTLGGSFDGKDKTRSLGMKNIIKCMEEAGVKRLIALGGMGVLADANGGYRVNDSDYPAQYKPVGLEHLQAYELIKASPLDWTFVCSPDILDKNTTGKYITASENMPENNHGQIAAGDLADFMLNELQENKYVHQRVGISRL